MYIFNWIYYIHSASFSRYVFDDNNFLSPHDNLFSLNDFEIQDIYGCCDTIFNSIQYLVYILLWLDTRQFYSYLLRFQSYNSSSPSETTLRIPVFWIIGIH